MLLFTNNAFVPCTVLTCDVTVHALKKKKKKNVNPTHTECLDSDEMHVLHFTLFFFSLHTFLLQGTRALLSTIRGLKNIKNESHGTIHIFKNYFAIVFSVFNLAKISFIQTDLKFLLGRTISRPTILISLKVLKSLQLAN